MMKEEPRAVAPAAALVPVPSPTPAWRWIDADAVPSFARNVLLSPSRTRPVVAVTTLHNADKPTIDPGELALILGPQADVVALRTGDATWALTKALPSRLDVYNGAARIWWPGLSSTADPYEHPLLFMVASIDADVVAMQIIAKVYGGDGRTGQGHPMRSSETTRESDVEQSPAPTAIATMVPAVEPGTVTKSGKPVLRATVVHAQGAMIRVRVEDQEARIAFADETLESLAGRLHVGQTIPVFVARTLDDKTPQYSTQGLLRVASDVRSDAPQPSSAPAWSPQPNPVLEAVVTKIDGEQIRVIVDGEHLTALSTRGIRPDPWQRLPDVYRVGDVVRGRVDRIGESFVLVEVLPGARLIAPISELDWAFVKHPSDIVGVGERVMVKILDLDPPNHRGTVSIKQAYGGRPLPAVSLGPGHPLFLADAEGPDVAAIDGADEGDAKRNEQSRQKLEAAHAGQAGLIGRLRTANSQVTQLKKALRSAEDRLRALEERASGDLNPTSDENAFLEAVRVEYARRVTEGDRQEYPLRRMRVGREFLARLRDLEGISLEKVVEVCAQVACLRAHEVPAREVHALRAGDGGASEPVRPDGARAWRCSLQDNTPSARRLHWWDIPSKDRHGQTIEFASVSIHDDFSIPD